jgi:ATP-binding protein involved in chromosome partitioning
MNITKEQIIEELKTVSAKGLEKNIVELGMVEDVEIAGTAVKVTVAVVMADYPDKEKFKAEIRRAIMRNKWITDVQVVLTVMTSAKRAEIYGTAPDEMEGIKKVKKIVAVASGKGGVGKSSVSVNIAVSLAKKGYRVGILDADMHGPDIPMMLDIKERPVGSRGMLIPLEKYGIRVMSTATLAGDGTPVLWRGPLVNKAIREFLGHVMWDDLEFLVVDLPPGTGDAALTLADAVSLDGVIMVTTPQKVAMADVRRSIAMFREHRIRVIGVVENMSYFRIPGSDEVLEIFGSGGGARIAEAFDIPLLGKIPLDPGVRAGGDSGKPVALDSKSEAAAVFDRISQKVIDLTL